MDDNAGYRRYLIGMVPRPCGSRWLTIPIPMCAFQERHNRHVRKDLN
jgi:hypothetical protein